ncbi:MAG: hypothetical protein WKG00_05665 [Polyangiaceae bacterium]
MGKWVARAPRPTLAMVAVVSALAMLGFRGLDFSTDYRVFFSKEDPKLASFQLWRRSSPRRTMWSSWCAPDRATSTSPASWPRCRS